MTTLGTWGRRRGRAFQNGRDGTRTPDTQDDHIRIASVGGIGVESRPEVDGFGTADRTYREQSEVCGMGKGRGHIDQQVDQYWRTRTINEAQLQEYTSLRLICGCGRITDYPFTLLLQRRGVTRYSFLGNIRFRCKDCGGKDITISVRSQAPPGEQ
jgi:hypothetical protein